MNQSAELRDPASQPDTSRLSFVRNSTRVTNDTRCTRHPDLIALCHFFRGTFPLPDLVNPQHSRGFIPYWPPQEQTSSLSHPMMQNPENSLQMQEQHLSRESTCRHFSGLTRDFISNKGSVSFSIFHYYRLISPFSLLKTEGGGHLLYPEPAEAAPN